MNFNVGFKYQKEHLDLIEEDFDLFLSSKLNIIIERTWILYVHLLFI